jgi:hypothetical protein
MRIGLTVTKDVLFRGVQQEFHNTYFYNLSTAVTAPAQSLIDDVVTTEKAIHSLTVNFKRAQVWSAGGTQAQNQMLLQVQLTGVGSSAADVNQDRERAVLIRWPAGFDVRGLPVYLRKYYHVCGSFGVTALTATGILANTAALSDNNRSAIATKASEVQQIGTGEFWDLCAKSGRERTGDAQCHKYLEHHQLGDMWR